MKMTPTLNGYLARRFAKNLVFLLGILLAIVFLFDTVELIRRASKREDIPLSLIFEMALLKLPEQGQIIFSFAILYSAMLTFWQLSRRYELVVVRAAGFSVWQFLLPIVSVAVLAGIVQMTIINPVSAVMVGRYQQLESRYIESLDTEIAIFREGLWLRQASAEGYVIVHAPKIQQADWILRTPVALFFNAQDQFIRRIDAQSAHLKQQRWIFDDSIVHDAEGSRPVGEYIVPTTLTQADVEESFSSPSSLSFWRLPGHIQTLNETGFDSRRLQVYYQTMLAQPLLFVAMVLIAAAVALRSPRAGQAVMMVVLGIGAGFILFFLSSFLQAMGSSHQIPVVLAAWSPSFIALLLGLSVMMRYEDG